jgi:hypothetical protein
MLRSSEKTLLFEKSSKNFLLTYDICVGTIVALGSFRMPVAGFVLILDVNRVTGKVLFRGNPFRRGKRCLAARERFGKHVVELIRPPTVVLDNPVVDLCHVVLPGL